MKIYLGRLNVFPLPACPKALLIEGSGSHWRRKMVLLPGFGGLLWQAFSSPGLLRSWQLLQQQAAPSSYSSLSHPAHLPWEDLQWIASSVIPPSE